MKKSAIAQEGAERARRAGPGCGCGDGLGARAHRRRGEVGADVRSSVMPYQLSAVRSRVPERAYPGTGHLVTTSYAGHTGPMAVLHEDMTSRRRPTGHRRARPARPRRAGGPSSPRSCAAAASGSPPRMSACHRGRRARRACAARRSRSSPGSASPGTPGSSRAATSTVGRRCSTRSPARCGSTRTSAPTCSGWPTCPTRRRRTPAGAARLDPTVLDQLDPFPAAVVNGRYDLLAYNRTYAALMGSLDESPPEDRNTLRQMLHDPDGRCRWSTGSTSPRVVATFRAAMAEHVGEPAWKCFLSGCWSCRSSPRSGSATRSGLSSGCRTDLLSLRRAAAHGDDQPVAGESVGIRMVTYTPTDDETRARLDDLYDEVR